jgi:chromosome partitioning protein
LATVANRQSILREKFAPIATRYDVVLIDCPPSLGLLTLNALALAQEVFVPMQAHFLALQGVGRLLETVGRVCQGVNTQLRVTGILLCMHENQTTLAKEIEHDLGGFFEQARGQDVPWRDCRVLEPVIRRNIKLAEAPSFGKTIFDYAPWCPGALDYRKMAETLLAAWSAADVKQTPAPITPTVQQPERAAQPAEPKTAKPRRSRSERGTGDRAGGGKQASAIVETKPQAAERVVPEIVVAEGVQERAAAVPA